jgi:dihydroneopterin aldolase/2-amino-4-hydroxy-6-hydroxymethyldihydropteridine diphosphokinase
VLGAGEDEDMTITVSPYFRNGVQLDTVVVEGITAVGRHGVAASEREKDQTFVADVVAHLDTRLAGREDELSKTVNYATVATLAAGHLAGDHVDLIETLAERIAFAVLEIDTVYAVDVVVHKPEAPIGVPVADTYVVIRRDVRGGDLWADKRIGSAAGLADDPQAPGAVPEPKDELDERPGTAVPALLALGGNVGDVEFTLARAVEDLDRVAGIRVVAVSPLVSTKPIGGPDQPDFLNAVVRIETTLSPRSLLHVAQGIEMVHGRERAVVNGPRTLDIDIIIYDDVVAAAEDLVVPHPRAHERSFVLSPWGALEPDAVLLAGPGRNPTRGGRVVELAVLAPDAAGTMVVANPWDPIAAIRSRAAGSPLPPPAPAPTG